MPWRFKGFPWTQKPIRIVNEIPLVVTFQNIIIKIAPNDVHVPQKTIIEIISTKKTLHWWEMKEKSIAYHWSHMKRRIDYHDGWNEKKILYHHGSPKTNRERKTFPWQAMRSSIAKIILFLLSLWKGVMERSIFVVVWKWNALWRWAMDAIGEMLCHAWMSWMSYLDQLEPRIKLAHPKNIWK